MPLFREYKKLDLVKAHKNILKLWGENNTFKKSVENRNNKKPFNFNAVWEFDNKNKQEEVMNLIKNHNREFQGPIPSKSLNTYGDISIILKY